jgi:magnesium chelatase subunit D
VREELVSIANEIKRQGIHLVVIDSDDDFLKLGYNKEIVEASDGAYYRLDELDSKKVVDVIKALPIFEEKASHRADVDDL